MPFFAKLATTTQVGHHVNSISPGSTEGWRQADIETAIAVEQGRILPVVDNVLFACNEHGHFGAVFAGVPNLFRGKQIRVEVNLRCFEHLDFQ